MKGIYLLIQNRALGKKVVYYEGDRLDRVGSSKILRKFDNNVTGINSEDNNQGVKSHYGLEEAFFTELFLPDKVDVLKNDIFDIIVEQSYFMCFPYYFPGADEEDDKKQKKHHQKMQARDQKQAHELFDQMQMEMSETKNVVD